MCVYVCMYACMYVSTYVLRKIERTVVHFSAGYIPKKHPAVLCTNATCVLMKTTPCFIA